MKSACANSAQQNLIDTLNPCALQTYKYKGVLLACYTKGRGQAQAGKPHLSTQKVQVPKIYTLLSAMDNHGLGPPYPSQ